MPRVPSRKKPAHAIDPGFAAYLQAYGREVALPLTYADLAHFQTAVPVLDAHGEDTLWKTVYYAEHERAEVVEALKHIYALLNTDGDDDVIDHLEVARVDYCEFGNTRPFRVRIRNRMNDNFDHYYVKRADANRVYGLELEHILSPNRITFLLRGDTLVEEHIAGVPGDNFIERRLAKSEVNRTRLAKEFVKFNERCFVRLLGDMRAYNYVVDITPDIEGNQYRLRAIDFDQQSYEGDMRFYLPQYFRGNNPILKKGFGLLTPESVTQYQLEERALIAMRARTIRDRLGELLDCMREAWLSPEEKVRHLAAQLDAHHRTHRFGACRTMGELVATSIDLVTEKAFQQGISSRGVRRR